MSFFLSLACRHEYVSGFSLDLALKTESEVTALSGPSGSGKTTLLSLIAGLLRPDAGEVCFDEEIWVDTNAGIFLPPERRGVGLLFQDHCLFPHLKVEANLTYGMRRRGGDSRLFDRIIKILELETLLKRSPRTLSGGQQQRVALARAIASSPKILLLDEPLTAIEVPLRERISAFIERVVEEFRIPILLVSHNNSLIDRLAKHVILIENGRVLNKLP